MNIGELFKGICEIPAELSNIAVSGVTSDTREVESGFVFVCIKGERFDGHSKAAEMLKKGAAAVVTAERLGLQNEINVPSSRAGLSRTAVGLLRTTNAEF